MLAWPFGQAASIRRIKGSRAFRRRLMELGLVPGTRIRVAKVAPLGDPLELEVRGSRLSLRRHEIAALEVSSPERPRRLRVLS
ncbi:MAG: ferrous iron transport protein A [Proteobacteria bacterium]|nr:ferrous iron transport protein A [Pseudomonadota bacterium]